MENVADIYGLSPMQELMLLHTKTAATKHDILFNQVVYAISGGLNVDAYRQAWQLMVDRHPALRTLFVWRDEKAPVQVVREHLLLPWAELDWQALTPVEQEQALERLLADDRTMGFDVLRPPLMRLALARVAPETYWLVWSSHHLVLDRWCTGILFDEVARAYAAFAGQAPPALAPAPAYRDYIAWLADQDEPAARAYWQQRLEKLNSRRLLLHDARGNAAPPTLRRHSEAIDGDEYAALRAFATGNNLTLSTLVAGAWAVVLAGATGEDDTLFGLTVSGRPADLSGAGQSIGCFINNVPLRVKLDDAPTVLDLLQALQESQLELKPYEYVSPAQIQTWCRDLAPGPLFDTLLVLQAPTHLAMPDGLVATVRRNGMQTGYPISLSALPEESKLRITLTYDTRLVPETLAEGLMVAAVRTLLDLRRFAAESPARLRNRTRLQSAELPSESQSKADNGPEPIYMPAQTAAERQIAAIWTEILGRNGLHVNDRYFDLGGDSLGAVRLLTLIEQRMGQRLPLSLLLRNPTVAEMAEAIGQTDAAAAADPVLQPVNAEGSRPPFFYAHGVFGDVLNLRHAMPLMDPDQPIYGLEAIGLRPDREPDRSIEAMAARYVESMRRVQPSGPYYVGGYCFGGVIAYEMARQLELQGEECALVAIIEGIAPIDHHEPRALWQPDRRQIIKQSVPYWTDGYQEFGGWRLRERIGAKLTGLLGHANGSAGETTPNFDPDNMTDYDAARPEIQFKLREVSYHAAAAYVPKPFGGHVTLIRARAVPLSHALLRPLDPLRGWGRLAGGGVTLRYAEGSHTSILRPPHAASLAATLSATLQEAQDQQGHPVNGAGSG